MKIDRRSFIKRLGLLSVAPFVGVSVASASSSVEYDIDVVYSGAGTYEIDFTETSMHVRHMPSAAVLAEMFHDNPALTMEELDKYDWYLVEPRDLDVAGACVWCDKVLDHPFYTSDPHVYDDALLYRDDNWRGKMTHQQHLAHPVFLWPSKDGETDLPGRGELFVGQVSDADGFAYVPICGGRTVIEVDPEGNIV